MKQDKDRPLYDLLPEIYREDRVLNTLLSVLEGQYVELEQEIDALPQRLYDPQQAPQEFLTFLQELVGLRAGEHIYSEPELRKRISRARMFRRRKGTRSGLQAVLEEYLEGLCGHRVPVTIVEYRDWCDYSCSPELRQHYEAACGGENGVRILVQREEALDAEGGLARLHLLVEEYTPATADVQIQILEKRTASDKNSFLGYNTWL